MRIEDIIIQSLAVNKVDSTVLGDVLIILNHTNGEREERQLSLCVPHHRKFLPEAMIMGEAIRRIRRSPEIRVGLERLSFAKGFKPITQVHRPVHAVLN